MKKVANRVFKEYHSHDDVRCEDCGKSLNHVKPDVRAFDEAPNFKVCKPCYKVNWYTLVAKPFEPMWYNS